MDRLTRMQLLLNDAELAVLDLEGVRSILDVGCGLGQMTRAMARKLGPRGRVLGIEREARQRGAALEQARQAGEESLVEIREGDATDLPLRADERGVFDLAHARFLLEHVSDPQAVVDGMVAAVRPGGRVVLLDDDHEMLRLWPECPALEGAWRVYWEGYRDHDCDPLIGRRLPELLRNAGAQPTCVTTVFYGATRGMPHFDLVVDNLIGVIAGAADSLVTNGRITRAELQQALESERGWRRTEAATVWYSLPFVEATAGAASRIAPEK